MKKNLKHQINIIQKQNQSFFIHKKITAKEHRVITFAPPCSRRRANIDVPKLARESLCEMATSFRKVGITVYFIKKKSTDLGGCVTRDCKK